MIKGLGHVCLTVKDLEASVAFYRDKLGLAEAFDFIRDGRRHGVYLHAGGRNFLELFEGPLDPPAPRQRFRHFCLEVDDIHAAVQQLRAAGLETSEVEPTQDGSLHAWLADPDGNRVELLAYTPNSQTIKNAGLAG
ncbi:MAG: VOC family protein [Phycisphaerae bacterium]